MDFLHNTQNGFPMRYLMLEKLLEFIRSKIFEKIAIAIVFVNVIVVYILIYHMYSIIDYATLIRYIIKCLTLEFFVAAFAIIYNILTREK